MAKILLSLNRDELNELNYSVVVETLNKGFFGRMGRKFDKQFGGTEKENKQARNRAKYWYDIFQRWYFVRGTPDHHNFSADTLVYVKQLIHFCGSN